MLVEIVAKKGKTKLTPLLELYVTKPISRDAIRRRRGEFKMGVFNQPDTELSDDEIIAAGTDRV
jgi:hypothetical protein